jgi:hypothetical protein
MSSSQPKEGADAKPNNANAVMPPLTTTMGPVPHRRVNAAAHKELRPAHNVMVKVISPTAAKG